MKDSFKKMKSIDKIIISKTNNGYSFVVLNKVEYKTKKMVILNDKTKFKELSSVNDNTKTT